MHIRILGNSITNVRKISHQPKTFVDILEQHYSFVDRNPSYRGIPRCSEERILYFLKKFKTPDVVIIFHGSPTHEFCPSCASDFANGTIDDEAVEYMTDAGIVKEFFENANVIPKTLDSVKKRYDPKTTQSLLESHKNLYYNSDLQMNRYQGALVLIDQYVTAKKINAIHMINSKYIPSWFKFNSGIVCNEFLDYQNHPDYSCTYNESANAITEQGNRIIADRLIEYVDLLLANSNKD